MKYKTFLSVLLILSQINMSISEFLIVDVEFTSIVIKVNFRSFHA
jgi:hypothetical protein